MVKGLLGDYTPSTSLDNVMFFLRKKYQNPMPDLCSMNAHKRQFMGYTYHINASLLVTNQVVLGR